jgi:hypothetical protein
MAPYPGPPAWKEVTNQTRGASWIRERLPSGQDLASYRDIVTYQAFGNLAGADPAAFLRGLFARVGEACSGVRVNGPKAAREGGYDVAYAQIYCGLQKGQPFGVTMFYKAIKGTSALYVVNRDFRAPPSEVAGQTIVPKGQERQAMAFMKAQAAADAYLVHGVYLCGAAAADPRCRR